MFGLMVRDSANSPRQLGLAIAWLVVFGRLPGSPIQVAGPRADR